jgi:hypothetical protein
LNLCYFNSGTLVIAVSLCVYRTLSYLALPKVPTFVFTKLAKVKVAVLCSIFCMCLLKLTNYIVYCGVITCICSVEFPEPLAHLPRSSIPLTVPVNGKLNFSFATNRYNRNCWYNFVFVPSTAKLFCLFDFFTTQSISSKAL